jgi:hypothetical protein
VQTYFSGTPWARRRAQETAARAADEALLLRRVVEELTRTVTRLDEANGQLRAEVERLRSDLDGHIGAN